MSPSSAPPTGLMTDRSMCEGGLQEEEGRGENEGGGVGEVRGRGEEWGGACTS